MSKINVPIVLSGMAIVLSGYFTFYSTRIISQSVFLVPILISMVIVAGYFIITKKLVESKNYINKTDSARKKSLLISVFFIISIISFLFLFFYQSVNISAKDELDYLIKTEINTLKGYDSLYKSIAQDSYYEEKTKVDGNFRECANNNSIYCKSCQTLVRLSVCDLNFVKNLQNIGVSAEDKDKQLEAYLEKFIHSNYAYCLNNDSIKGGFNSEVCSVNALFAECYDFVGKFGYKASSSNDLTFRMKFSEEIRRKTNLLGEKLVSMLKSNKDKDKFNRFVKSKPEAKLSKVNSVFYPFKKFSIKAFLYTVIISLLINSGILLPYIINKNQLEFK